MIYGYTRDKEEVSKIFAQMRTISFAGEVYSGEKTLHAVKQVLKQGDILVISSLDDFGTKRKNVVDELIYFRSHKIQLQVLELPYTLVDFFKAEIDPKIAALKTHIRTEMLIQLYESETNRIRRRQRAGIDSLRQKKDYKYGRSRKVPQNKLKEVIHPCILQPDDPNYRKPGELMDKYNISPATFYRYKKQYLADLKSKS